jgi:peptidoglycan/LPS O-acetylase OafA/YrhL
LRYKSLDGLRGLAAYTVVISHFGNSTDLFGAFTRGSGQIGVMLFFVLSGFLMSKRYIQTDFNGNAVLDFYLKRIARVIPLYIVVVLASYAMLSIQGYAWPLFRVTNDNVLNHLFFIKGESVLWTIPAEVQFYFLFSLLWLIYSRFGVMIYLVVPLSISFIASLGYPQSPAVLPFLPFFLLGLAASMIPAPHEHSSANVIFAVSLLGYFAIFPGVRMGAGLAGGLWFSPICMFFFPALVFVSTWSSVAERVLGNRVSRFFGNISYSVYLLHMPILICLGGTTIRQHPVLFLALFISATTVLSWLSFRFIEIPCQRIIAGGSIRQRSSRLQSGKSLY